MSSSFADSRIAALPMGDLQGTISTHFHLKEEKEICRKERSICEGELSRLGRALDTLNEISLPFMPNSSRTAVAVREARSGSIISGHGGASSRSPSAVVGAQQQQEQQQQQQNASNFLQQARADNVKACAHQIKDAVAVVTNLPREEDDDDKKANDEKNNNTKNITAEERNRIAKRKALDLPVYNIESKVIRLTHNEDFDSVIKNRQNNTSVKRPTFRKLAPTWNRHQYQKHKDVSAKNFKSLGPSMYHSENGEVQGFQTEKMMQAHEESKARSEAAEQKIREDVLYALHFSDAKFAAQAIKSHDAERRGIFQKEAQERRNSPHRRRGSKKEWHFQVPSLLTRSKSAQAEQEQQEKEAVAAQ